MAVLVRAMGIPARVAAGYAQGVFDPVTQRYIVNPTDSHTWVEVFFPTYGWVLFEPSGFRAPEVRGGAADGIEGEGGLNPDAADLSVVDDFLDELEDMDVGNFQPLEPAQGHESGSRVSGQPRRGGSGADHDWGRVHRAGDALSARVATARPDPESTVRREPTLRAHGPLGRTRWVQYEPRVHAG